MVVPTTTDTSLVRSLDAVPADDDPTAVLGRKAARLAELRAAGFPVPPGLVLTVAAYERALAAGPELPVPPEVRAALGRIAAEFGDVPLAVRSSGVAEDAGDRSYAGRYETVLGVVGTDALVDAVTACWASARHPDLLDYQRVHGDDGGLAVLVQPMVPADAAGVAFTANPVTGARDEIVVNAVRGLGAGLVAGLVAAEEWVVRSGTTPERTAGPDEVLRADQVERLAGLARRVAASSDCPQDIEWAWVGDEPVLLQARPITALPQEGPEPVPVPFEVPPGFWLRGGYTLKPLSPMNLSTLIRAVNETSDGLFRYAFGQRVEVISLGGWSYVRIVPLPDLDAMRERARLVVAAGRADRHGDIVDRWYADWLPDLLHRLAEVRAVDLAGLTAEGLNAELARRVTLAYDAQRLHFLVGGVSSMVWGELGVVCRDLLGWSAADVLPLLTGLPGKASEPALELARLADLARPDPSVLAHPRGEFAAALHRYLVEYGQRCLGADIAEPSMAEQPSMVLRLVANQVTAGTDSLAAMRDTMATRDRAVAAARARLSGADRHRFDRALGRAERAFPLRDDTGFQAHVCWGQVRYALLELAGRLVARAQLAAVSDVFLLTLDEAREALADGADRRPLAARRAGEQAWSRANLGPLTYGEHVPGPSREAVLDELSPAERAVLEPMLWIDQVSDLGARQVAAQGDRLLHGTAASAGRYAGPVRVVRSEREFDRLGPGDVLVCPETTPQWSVLFGIVGALVTDTGGLLSHPSILAREHGIPAVVATGNATEVLRDGQLVVVDGLAGTVEVLEPAH